MRISTNPLSIVRKDQVIQGRWFVPQSFWEELRKGVTRKGVKKGPVQKLFANCKECQCEKRVEKCNETIVFEPKLTPATDVMKDLSHLSHGSAWS